MYTEGGILDLGVLRAQIARGLELSCLFVSVFVLNKL